MRSGDCAPIVCEKPRNLDWPLPGGDEGSAHRSGHWNCQMSSFDEHERQDLSRVVLNHRHPQQNQSSWDSDSWGLLRGGEVEPWVRGAVVKIGRQRQQRVVLVAWLKDEMIENESANVNVNVTLSAYENVKVILSKRSRRPTC